MIARSRRAFTLIELLIVVAILAIMAAASMRMVIGPMQEEAFASIDQAQQAGLATVVARLVEESHSATALQPLENGLILQGAGPGGQSHVRYAVDADGHLRRSVVAEGETPGDTDGAALLDNVQAFTAEQDVNTTLWTIRLVALQARYNREIKVERDITLAVGTAAWAGGGGTQ